MYQSERGPIMDHPVSGGPIKILKKSKSDEAAVVHFSLKKEKKKEIRAREREPSSRV